MNKLKVILFLLLTCGSMYGQNQEKISISFTNITIENAIKQLDAKASNIDFSYSNNLPDLQNKVNKKYTNKSIESILTDLLSSSSLNYKNVGNTIIIIKNKNNNNNNKANKKPTRPKTTRTISGYIYDDKTGESLIGATVSTEDMSVGTSSNSYGFYSITVPLSATSLKVNFLGYKETKKDIDNNTQLDFYIVSSDNALGEVVVSSSKTKINNFSGTKTITVQQIKETPQLLGEPDIIKALQTQSGIKTVTDGSSFYYVRGGNFDQNLVLLDEAPLYNPSHIMGLVSVINGDAIKSSDFYKGYFPARYSGKLSSVLDVTTKDGNNKEFHLTSGVSTIGVRLSLEGPIVKDKASYMISLRRSWVDRVVKMMKIDNEILSPSFYDINAKFNWRINRNNRIYFSVYHGNDLMKYDPSNFNAQWNNNTATLRWNHVYNSKLFANTSLIYNRFKSSVEVSKTSKAWLGSVNEGRLIHKMNYYLNDNHSFVGGVKLGYHQFVPGWSEDNKVNIGTKQLMSSDVFLEHKIKLGNHFTFDYGVNAKFVQALSNEFMIELNDKYEVVKEYDKNNGKTKTWFELEPRVNVNYAVNKNNNLFASYSRMNQYSHSLYPYQNDFDIFKMWIPVSNNVKPMQSDVFSLGYNYASEHFSCGVEGYYKLIKNQLDYTAYPDLQSKYYEKYLRAGNGNSYGAEFSIGYKTDKYNVEINYAYSKTKLKTPDVNGGEEYISRYDIPHQINITAKYNISKRWQFSAYWKFASGKPFTLPVGTQMVNGGTTVLPIYGERYNARFLNYHRLDIMFTLLPSSKPKRFKGTLSFGVMNAYGKDNPISINYRYTYTTLNPESQAFFKWLPMISYQIKF